MQMQIHSHSACLLVQQTHLETLLPLRVILLPEIFFPPQIDCEVHS